MRRRRRRACRATDATAAGALAVAVAVVVAGCSQPPDAWRGEAELIQGRTARGAGTIGVRLSPDEDVLVRSMRVDAGAGEVTWTGSTDIGAGRSVVLQVPLPPPDCAAAHPRTVARIGLLGPDGVREVRAPLDDPYDAVSRLAAEECAAAAVARIAEVRAVELDTTGTGRATTATLVVDVRPTGDSSRRLRIERVAPTVLLRPPRQDAAAWLPDLVVHASDGPARLRLPIEPARCDAHAVAEDKVGTVFPVSVRIAGRAAEVALPLADDVKPALLRYVNERCGFTSGEQRRGPAAVKPPDPSDQ